MRVSTAFAYARTQEEILNRQASLAKAQDQLSTGMRVQTPSDDPYAAAQAERARSTQVHIEIDRRSSSFARSSLGSLEGALGNAGDVLQQVRETVLTAGNGVQSMSDRAAIAAQLKQMRSELLGVANRSDSSGGYLFGGQGSRIAPFVDGAVVQYQAQAGNQYTGQSLQAETAIDGGATFTSVPGASGNLNIFSVIDSAITALQDPTINSGSLALVLQPTVVQLDQGLDVTFLQRAKVGERLRQLDVNDQNLSAAEVTSKAYSAEITEVDYAKAITEVNAQQTNLQAVMKTYVQVSNLSLFNFIR